MSKKTRNTILILLFGVALFYFGYWINKDKEIAPPPNEQHVKQQKVIDSLEQVVKQERKARELAERKFEQSDSLARVFWDSLNQQFNDNERDARLRAVNELDDSASFEFFSKWLSESDGD